MRTIDELLQRAVSGCISRSDAEELCVKEGLAIDALYNNLALRVARQFFAGAMTFRDGDAAMNAIYGMMIDDASRFGDGFELAEPAYSIYLAFDAGEYDHGDGSDPVENFTRPLVANILEPA